jgi:hypothetical protein
MSLKVTKENIFFLLPESRYAVSERIDAYMEKDFTVYVKAKLFPETLTQTESFLLARNGMHTGISAFKDSDDNNNVMFTYWFKDADDVPSPKQIFYTLGDDILNEFNEYIMIGDDENETISCYINGKLIGEITYGDDRKQTYENSFYWFGCGSMIGPEEHRAFGDFEYKMAFVLNKKISLDDINDLTENYEEKYTDIVFNDLRKIKNSYPLRENFAFFCDFKHYNRYKVWDLSFSGNYPQFYIEHNIYF